MRIETLHRQADVLADCAPRLRAVRASPLLLGDEREAARQLLKRVSRRCEIAAADLRWALRSVPLPAGPPERKPPPLIDDLADAARVTAQVAGEMQAATETVGLAIGDCGVARSLGKRRWQAFRFTATLTGRLIVALTNPQGLGLASGTGSGLSKAVARVGILLGRESLAAGTATASVILRMEIAFADHPELRRDPLMTALFAAIRADRTAATIARLATSIKARGGEKVIATLAPVLPEILALGALQDENPFNDAAAWELVLGLQPLHDPILGIPLSWISKLDEGEGYARSVELDPEVGALLGDGGLVAWLRTVQHLGGSGQIVIQHVREDRWLIILPGMGFGAPCLESPQDLVGAFRNTNDVESPYVRAVRLAIAHSGVPSGARLALIGHSAGGAAAMNLVQDEAFSSEFTVTHVVAVGSPIDFKKPADPRTWVASITNQHDIVPTLDGRGSSSPFAVKRDWFEVDYVDDTHEFPICHSAGKYADNLSDGIADACARIDAAVSAYRGKPRQTHVYAIYDRRP